MEDTIEVAPGAPKANKIQPRTPSGSQRQKQKQKQEQSIGETPHLVEIVLSAMDELYSNIQEQRVHNEASSSSPIWSSLFLLGRLRGYRYLRAVVQLLYLSLQLFHLAP